MSRISTLKYDIDTLKEDDCNLFLDLHFEGLFKKSRFSKVYLNARFYYILNNSNIISVVVRDLDGKIMGLVYGGNEGYKKTMNQEIFKRIFIKLLFTPWVLFSNEITYKLKKIFYRNTKQQAFEGNRLIDLKKPILRLTGIAVFEKHKRTGIGETLIAGFISRAVQLKYNSILLETPIYNVKAISFYEKLNWLKLDESNSKLGKTYFYKNL